MKMRKLLTNIVSISMLLFWASGCASVIAPGNRGLKWRPLGAGLDRKEIYDNGIVWHLPWNDVIKYNVQWKNYSERVALLTADDLHIVPTVSIVMRPKIDEIPQLHLEIGHDWYNNVVKPEFMTVTRNVFANYLHNEVPKQGLKIEKEIYSAMVERLKGKHLTIDNVTIDHVMYSRIVTEAVDRKLSTKQRLEEKEYEIKIAEKNAEILRIKADGQMDAQKIIDKGLTIKYLQFKALEVQEKLSASPNAKFYFIPIGKDGLPIIIDSGI